MTAIYDLYKPLRNFLRQCSLEGVLVDLWRLSSQTNNGTRTINLSTQPPGLWSGLIAAWDLSTIAKEIVLHAQPNGTKRLNSEAALRHVIGMLRDLEDEASKLRLVADDGVNDVVFIEMLRLTHRQFPWQQGSLKSSIVRNFKIFSTTEIAPMVERQTGLSVKAFFLLGLALSGHLLSKCGINSDQDYSAFGISRAQVQTFFGRLSMDYRDLRRVIETHQSIDANWDYTWNPLEATPLISLDASHPNRLHCPVPELLLRRFSGGLYYDLIEEPGFGNAFGTAYEDYIGEVLAIAFASTAYRIHKEQPYLVGKNMHRGPDWIVCGPDGNLFIECKTKRLTQAAKSASGDVPLLEDIGKIADAIVQHYKNVLEAVQGKSQWEPNSQQSWPVVITFEDWYFLGSVLKQLLDDEVTSRLTVQCMDTQITQSMPYFVMSTREFEMCAGAISEVGISAFFKEKLDKKYSDWLWPEYLASKFPKTNVIDFHRAFETDWRKIIPDAAMPLND